MPQNPLETDLRAWLTAAYREHWQMLEYARAEADASRRALLEAEAKTLEGCCLTLEDCLYAHGVRGKQIRRAMYEEMGKYQRYADELQNAADEQEAARVAAVCAVYRRVVQEWAEILEGR